MWWKKTEMDWNTADEEDPTSVSPTDTAHPDRLTEDDSTASDSFLAPTQPAKSVSPMANYFYDPQSPHVSMISAVPSSPASSPSLTSTDQNWGKRYHTSTIPLPEVRAPLPSASFNADPIMLDEPSEDGPVQTGSPVRSSVRRSSLSGPRRTKTTNDALTSKENVPPVPSTALSHILPGFGNHELEHKVLPCFPVKSDGLMRVSCQTVRDLMKGHYDDRVSGYQIVDCRFAYEHEGGHIAGSINLNSIEQIQQHFLTPGSGLHAEHALPPRTQSGHPDEQGSTRKFVLIFHCEFSFKRGPSLALALRQADRSLSNDYPKCHFPDMYILQGGYAEFFRTCPEMCEPRAYVGMDDPRYLRKRSSELSGFRRQFSRNRSFAYGDGQVTGSAAAPVGSMRRAPSLMPSLPLPTVTGSPPRFSPTEVATAAKTKSGSTTAAQHRMGHIPAFGKASSLAPPDLARDVSYSSCDSSFDGSTTDSPCAVARSGRPALMDLPQPQQRAAMANRLLRRADTTPSVTLPP